MDEGLKADAQAPKGAGRLRVLDPTAAGGYVSAQDVLDWIEVERQRHQHTKEGAAGGPRLPDPRATRECYGCSRAHRVLDDLARKINDAFLPIPAARGATSEPSRPCCDVCTP